MPDPNERDAKLIQYMNEAYGKEKELEVALVADIALTTKPPYKKRLQQHLKETKGHAKALERRIKKLGGSPSTTQSLVGKATAAAKGPLHIVRGDGAQEKMLKNAKTQYSSEHEEISTYLALEIFATKVADKETAKLAREVRKDEERMAKFLEGQIKQLSGAVAIEDVPAAQRRSAGAAKPKARKASSKSTASKSTATKSTAKPAAKKSTAKKSGGAKKASVKKAASKSTRAKKPATKKASARKSTAKKATAKKS
jgi:ferritin-like metal-binding protein YciE